MWYLLADANGFGWWDSDMEGVDSEAVGYGESLGRSWIYNIRRNRMALILPSVSSLFIN